MEGFALMPAAITMVAGPQIISAVVLATSTQAKRNSLAFLSGALAAVLLGTAMWLVIISLLSGGSRQPGESASPTSLDYVLAALLAYVAVRAFLGRKSAEPPKWMSGLQQAEPKAAVKLGLLLFFLMPTDVAMMVSVARYLTKNDLPYWYSLPFLMLTMTLISLPFLTYLVLGSRAERSLPKVRDWMSEYSWAINIGICVYFIYSLLA